MIKSVFYKEWIKTRLVVSLCLLTSIGFLLYTQIRIGNIIELRGIAYMWEIMLFKDVIFIDLLRYIPLLLGLFVGLAQFVPEISQKRLKLMLHLPYSQFKLIFAMMGYGLLCLSSIFLLNFLWLFLFFKPIFASEFVSRIFLTAAPWYLAGIAGYALIAWICVEPTWKFRIINTSIAIAFVDLFFTSPEPEAYNGILSAIAFMALIVVGFVWLSVNRFKSGRQD